MTHHHTTRQATAILFTLRRLIRDQPTLTREQAAELGNVLFQIIDEAQVALQYLKEVIRADMTTGPGKYQVQRTPNSPVLCTVQVRGPNPTLRKGADLDALRSFLGEDQFASLFDTRKQVTPNSRILERIRRLPETTKARIRDVLSLDIPRARVSFLRNR